MVTMTAKRTNRIEESAEQNGFYVVGDRIAIKPDEAEEMTKGGIALPPSAVKEQQPIQGTVVAVGTGKFHSFLGKRVPPPIAVGQRVMFEKFVGNLLEINGVRFKLIREDDVLAVITK